MKIETSALGVSARVELTSEEVEKIRSELARLQGAETAYRVLSNLVGGVIRKVPTVPKTKKARGKHGMSSQMWKKHLKEKILGAVTDTPVRKSYIAQRICGGKQYHIFVKAFNDLLADGQIIQEGKFYRKPTGAIVTVPKTDIQVTDKDKEKVLSFLERSRSLTTSELSNITRIWDREKLRYLLEGLVTEGKVVSIMSAGGYRWRKLE